ncbi:MAG: DUF4079 domain-containing protein [Leptolyngbya sp. SIO4C1]|nr:DUF4079 domain-containing protein [Leptolyngbya sp. SIO4C1]
MPEPIIHWGHPLMMGIVIFAMGTTAAYAGWKIRTADQPEETAPTRKLHKRVALWMTTFIALGYTGGLLSLVMQGEPILESPHFWTGTAIVGMLGLNGAISFSKFGGGKDSLRTAHAYIGTAAVALMFVHAFLGLNLGLSI